MNERRFWIAFLLALAVLRLVLLYQHPWPWLEGEEFDHIRPAVNLRAGLGGLPLDELWKQPLGKQGGGMTLVHTAAASLVALVLPGWWALKVTALGWSLAAAAAVISLGRRLGAAPWALAVTLLCILPVELESRLAAYGDYFESSAVAMVVLALCVRAGERALNRNAIGLLAAAATGLTWLTAALAPLGLLGLACLVRRDRWLPVVIGAVLGLTPKILFVAPGEALPLGELLASGVSSWTHIQAWPEAQWFEGWTDTSAALIPGPPWAAVAGRVVLGASAAGLLLVRGVRPGRRGAAIGVGLLGVALAHLLVLELLGFGVPGGPVDNESWNYRRMALSLSVLPIGGAVSLTLLARLLPGRPLRGLLAVVLSVPWVLAAAPGGLLLASGPDRGGFSDPTPVVLCHDGNGEDVHLCVGDINRTSLVALSRPWSVQEPPDGLYAAALMAIWSIINEGHCSFHSPPPPEHLADDPDGARFAWNHIGRGLGGRCPREDAAPLCSLAPPDYQTACLDGVREGRGRLDELGLVPMRHE